MFADYNQSCMLCFLYSETFVPVFSFRWIYKLLVTALLHIRVIFCLAVIPADTSCRKCVMAPYCFPYVKVTVINNTTLYISTNIKVCLEVHNVLH